MSYPITDGTSTVTSHAQFHNAVVDVKAHYGATGDGVADDTAEIQAAITAAGEGPCYIPPGIYNHTGLTMTTATHIIGAGANVDEEATAVGTRLVYTPSTGTALAVTDAANISGPNIEHISLVGSSAANNTIGIHLDGSGTAFSRGMLTSVRVKGFGTGIKTTSALSITFLNCYSVLNGQNLWLTAASNACSVIGGGYRQATTNGIHIDASGSIYIAPGVVVESNTTNGLLVDGADVSALTIGGHYENNGGRGIFFNGPVGKITDCSLHGVTVSANTGTDIDLVNTNHLKAFGIYYVDNGSLSLDAASFYNEFYGSRPPGTLTDSGISNYFFYPTTSGNGFLQMQTSSGGGFHLANGMLEMDEVSAPAAAAANRVYIYARDVAGKTQLAARFPTGAVQPIATEP